MSAVISASPVWGQLPFSPPLPSRPPAGPLASRPGAADRLDHWMTGYVAFRSETASAAVGPTVEVAGAEAADPPEMALDEQGEALDLLDLAEPTPPGQGLVDRALALLGTRYHWGGTTPAGFDCSGFIYFVLEQTGNRAPRDHGSQLRLGPQVRRADLRMGDLVFFQDTYAEGISHSGIYIGEGRFIHANDEDTGVIISDLSNPYWIEHWLGATRVT